MPEKITSLEVGDAVKVTGTGLTGRVVSLVGDLNGHPVGARVAWSDGDRSVERVPITGIEFT